MSGLEKELLQVIQNNLGEVAVNHLHDYIGNSEELKEKIKKLAEENKELRESAFELETEIEHLKALQLHKDDLDRRARELDERTNQLEISELQIKLAEANKRADAIESLTRKVIHGSDSHE